MPRIPRGATVGGIYHIIRVLAKLGSDASASPCDEAKAIVSDRFCKMSINRGNMGMQVFDDMEDFEYFLELLEKASKRENVEIHAYCLTLNLVDVQKIGIMVL
ncbi:MAG: hypothetical protein U9O24_10725, partial [Campylobacterota bacterium]|nr:hypothetical protein [Campylobacterota bacterium]